MGMIRLYDTARRAVVPFEPPPTVRMYVCGITPYDSTHLGHAATYLTYDILIRRLEDLGHEVRMVRNITDVDDSILPKARELGVPYLELAEAEIDAVPQRHGRARHAAAGRGAARHRIGAADHRARGRAARIGARLPERRHRVLRRVDVRRFGELSHYPRGPDGEAGARRGAATPTIRTGGAPLDFVLWQPSLADEPAWRAPFGVGRPGLAHRVLGDGDARARPDARPARRRHRPDLPAPRVRDRAERSRSPANRSRGTGCTRRWSTTRARRCRSRSATSCS